MMKKNINNSRSMIIFMIGFTFLERLMKLVGGLQDYMGLRSSNLYAGTMADLSTEFGCQEYSNFNKASFIKV
jgi:hypothetical protein